MGWFSKKKYVDARTGKPVDVNRADDGRMYVDSTTGETVGGHRIIESVAYTSRKLTTEEEMRAFFESHVVVSYTKSGEPLYGPRPS